MPICLSLVDDRHSVYSHHDNELTRRGIATQRKERATIERHGKSSIFQIIFLLQILQLLRF